MIVGENRERVCELVHQRMKKELKKGLHGIEDSQLRTAISQAVNIYHDNELDAILSERNDGTSSLCSACGYCCTNYKIQLTFDDVYKFGQEIDINSYIENDPDVEGRFKFKTIPCKFIGDDNRCQHYKIRPQSCQNFPLINPDGYVRMSRDSNCNYVIRFFVMKSFALLLQTIKEEAEDDKK